MRGRHRPAPRCVATPCQRGAALLLAMLVVALVATLAAAASWQQWRSTEVETAARARMQSDWLLTGAADWARLLLIEDAKTGGADHLSEPWAVPLQEARLSSFLAAERNVSVDMGDVPDDVFISGQIEDMQGRFNLANLVRNNQLSPPDVQVLQRLFGQLQLPPAQATQLADAWLRSARARSSPGSDPTAAPLPQRVQQLGWLGLPAPMLIRLAPYVALLPQPATSININTASAEVLQAVLGGSAAAAQAVVSQRTSQPFMSASAIAQAVQSQAGGVALGVGSDYFLVHGWLRLGALTLQQQSLLQRNGQQVQVLWRERGSFSEETRPQQAPQAR